MDHRVHHRLHPLTTTQPRRNPLRSEQDAFVLLVWVIGIAIVVALGARYAGIELALPLLAAGLFAVARLYFGVGVAAPRGGSGGSGTTRRRGRKARPYRGPSTKRARADAERAERAKRGN